MCGPGSDFSIIRQRAIANLKAKKAGQPLPGMGLGWKPGSQVVPVNRSVLDNFSNQDGRSYGGRSLLG